MSPAVTLIASAIAKGRLNASDSEELMRLANHLIKKNAEISNARLGKP
jgi:hypothetical protein